MSEKAPLDWKNSSDYPSGQEAKEASLDRWAWVFLARNPQFQKELTEARKEAPPSDDGQRGPIGWSQTPIGKVLKKWGVEWPRLPEWIESGLCDSPVVFQKHPLHAATVKIEGQFYRLMPESESRVVLEFDLAAPLAPQLTRAKQILDASKKQIKETLPAENRKQVAMYPFYLRVLDAKAANITKAKMAEVFSQECSDGLTEKDISNWLKAAEDLTTNGYKRLAKLSK
ncbi:MAG: hypothetical protein IPF44_06405 [Betaproteobacteria bacterium]|nr:hypothetical protein [Betaproteobacteria bacterium]MBP6203466.1 hypothetical protein [Azonexus sp.]